LDAVQFTRVQLEPLAVKRNTCSRRDVLKLAAGLGVAFTVPALEPAAAEKRGREREKSLLVLCLSGGPSQLETWDPHPGTKIGGPTRAIKTSIPSVKIADSFPLLADQLHRLSVIRSLVSQEGDHERATYVVRTGRRPDQTMRHPALGAIVSKEHPNPALQIPAFVSLAPHYGLDSPRGGYLGAEYDAFEVRRPGKSARDREQPHARERLQRRLANLQVVSSVFRRRRGAALDRTMHQRTVDAAVRMMTSDQQKAFSIDEEPQATRAAYGDSVFGRGCLVARRLIEQGVRAIEVTHENYDSHANNFERHTKNAVELDGAFAALLRDLSERNLLESTVVLCIGEFGRTPKINAEEGRDHWPSGFSCLVGGGGLRAGIVIGATDPTGERPAPENPIPIADLYTTILKTLNINPNHQVLTPIGRPMSYSAGTPIRHLLL
jgi:hypothetical protein